MNRALFLDRDGVINEDYGYVHKIEDFHFRDGIFDVCRAAQKARMKIIVITNQAGIGRGHYSLASFQMLSEYMKAQMLEQSVIINDIFYCPFHEDFGLGQYRRSSIDRKPRAGMIAKACNMHNINPFLSIMIGDKDSDRVAAERAGIKLYLSTTQCDWAERAIRLAGQI